MSPLRPSGAGILLVSGAVSGGLAVHDRVGWLEWTFLTVLLSALGLAVRQGVRAWRHAAAERREAARLSSVDPGAVALAAVRDERHRLDADLVGCLRQTLRAVEAEVGTTLDAPDPLPGIQRIRHQTQVATSELRRQLGLLRTAEDGAGEASAVTGATDRHRSPGPPDLAVAGLAVAVAAVESVVYPRIDGSEVSWVSLLLTLLAAATVVGRRAAPGPAAVACGGLFLVAVVLRAPVEGGFWSLVTVVGLLWTISARAGSSRAELAGGLFLVVSAAVQAWLLSRGNFGIGLAMSGAAVVSGLVVRWARRRAGSSAALADERATELRLAAASAVGAERRSYARELHDVVSHAVGLVAVQSGAAEVAWPVDPAASRQSLRVIGETARAALAELDRLSPGLPAGPRTAADLHALVARIRSAGTPVELQAALDPGAVLGPEVFRTVQEALTNVVRHAPGATARVTITTDDHETAVVVLDDGPVQASSAPRGYGLVGLAERVALAGGVLDTGTGPAGRGFRVAVTLPNRVGSVA